jgi:tRNA (guanosine-2'-O-)-methyltransferase
MTEVRRKLGSTDLKRLHRDWRRRTRGAVALVLENVQSPFNVGAILRSAAAFRAEHVWLVGTTASPRNPKTQKTALGTDRYLTIHTTPTVQAAAAQITAAGYVLIGVELTDDAVALHELVSTRLRALSDADPPALCLAFGNEEHGLSTACLDACDHVAYLPQLGKVGSLNVATAAAIALYEVRRASWTTKEEHQR